MIIEALVLLAPTTLLVVWADIFLLGAGLGDGLWHIQAAPLALLLISLVALASGWTLVFRFLGRGAQALRAEPTWLWVAAGVGGLLAVAALAIVANPFADPRSPPLGRGSGFGLLAAGSPAIVPLIHLWLERRRSMPANKRFERSREG